MLNEQLYVQNNFLSKQKLEEIEQLALEEEALPSRDLSTQQRTVLARESLPEDEALVSPEERRSNLIREHV